jgi:hypothetical protein
MKRDQRDPKTGKNYRGGRARFKKALDALEQLESIEKIQSFVRKRSCGEKIRSTRKSKQRLLNALRHPLKPEDFLDDFS